MKRLRLIAIVVVVQVLVGLVAYLTTPPEPSYQGRTLTEWLKIHAKYHEKSDPNYFNPDSREAASAEAIQRIGTNGIPTLLRLIEAKDSPMKDRANLLLATQSFIRFRFQPADELRYLAFLGFGHLGEGAMPTVPVLIQLMQTPDSSRRYQTKARAFTIAQDKMLVWN
jgi:hypothetical protein